MEPEGRGGMMEELQENIRVEKIFGAIFTRHESITVQNDIFDRFIDSCEKADQPNQNLVDALAFTRAWQVDMNAEI